MGQYCFAHWHLLSVVVCNTASRQVGRVRGRSAAAGPGTSAVVWPTARRASTVTFR